MSNNYKNTFIWTSEMTLWVNKCTWHKPCCPQFCHTEQGVLRSHTNAVVGARPHNKQANKGNENILTEKQNKPSTLNVYFSIMSSGSYRCLPGFCLLCFKCCLGLLHEYNVARLFSMSDLIFFCCCFRTWESISHWLRQDIFFSNFLSYLIQKSLLHFLRKSF